MNDKKQYLSVGRLVYQYYAATFDNVNKNIGTHLSVGINDRSLALMTSFVWPSPNYG